MEETRFRADCEAAFQAADEDGKGYLSEEDYKVVVLSLLGFKPSKYEVATVWRSHCARERAGLERNAFVSLMIPRLRKLAGDEVARQVFLSFDARCQGYITESDCARAFRQVAPRIPAERVREFFREVDTNGDGKVSYRDFELMLSHFNLVAES